MSPHQSIAHYRILSKLGAGGMGEVYRATDTKLGRDVALKILPESFAQDPDRMARFEREAKVLASLNHPNIAQIFGIEDRALVMELVEGENLQCPVPVETAIAYARQIAEAVEAAHEKGIVHRDLKPANIKVTSEGAVKVLDFGLAAMAQGNAVASGDPQNSPTLTMMGATQAGLILGTASYMSPEQAAGKPVDRRADIWSFGVVLWEMLAGKKLFEGETVSHTLADVLKGPIDFDTLPKETPAPVKTLLKRCLDRNVRNRLRDIGEARVALENAAQAAPEAPADAPRPAGKLPWIAATAATVAAGLLGLLYWGASRPTLRPMERFDSPFVMPERLHPFLALSPDGKRVAYVQKDKDGVNRLYTRLLDQPQGVLVPGTDNATSPFFSPDGQWLGFAADGQLSKIMVSGGEPIRLCPAPNMRGASWGDDGYIVFTPDNRSPLFRVSDAGGTPEPITQLGAGETTHRSPQILAGSSEVLFISNDATAVFDNSEIRLLSLPSRRVKTVYKGGYGARYLAGKLLWARDGVLFGAVFDPRSGELRGKPVPLLQDLATDSGSGLSNFEVSRAGMLVGISGSPAIQQNRRLLSIDSSGAAKQLALEPNSYVSPAMAPDGKSVALVLVSTGGLKTDIVIFDIAAERMRQLTFTGNVTGQIWSPDSQYALFATDRRDIFRVRADGSAAPELLISANRPVQDVAPLALSPDGRTLVLFSSENKGSLWKATLDVSDPAHPKAGQPEAIKGLDNLRAPALSPDFRWIAYTVRGSGIYVQPFPPTGAKWRVSDANANFPLWSLGGAELFYQTRVSDENQIIALPYRLENGALVFDKPRVRIPMGKGFGGSDMYPDGKRAIVLRAEENASPTKMTFVLNFSDELQRRFAAEKP